MSVNLHLCVSNGKPKDFFSPFFDKLAGNSQLKEQIAKGMSEDVIRLSWQKELEAFKKMRKKYLLYKD